MKRFFILILGLMVASATAQEVKNYRGSQYGLGFMLAELGAGISGYIRLPIDYNLTAGLVGGFYIMRDEGQVDLPNPYNPDFLISYNKPNNLYYLSLYGELKKRFGEDYVENSVRPFWVIGGGLIYGMNYPERSNQLISDGEGGEVIETIQPPNEFELGYQANLGFGIDISAGRDFTLSIRPQYKLIMFSDPIAGRNNHSQVELRFEFGSTKSL